MGIDASQLCLHVVRPVLQRMEMCSPSAERLVMGTIAVESDMGCFIRQYGGGPGRGIGQIEPRTAEDLLFRYLNKRCDIAVRFSDAFQLVNDTTISWRNISISQIEQKLVSDLRFSVAMIRLRYWIVPEPLPAYLDLPGLGLYWKKHYNTAAGAGTVADFSVKFRQYLVRVGMYGETGQRADAELPAVGSFHA